MGSKDPPTQSLVHTPLCDLGQAASSFESVSIRKPRELEMTRGQGSGDGPAGHHGDVAMSVLSGQQGEVGKDFAKAGCSLLSLRLQVGQGPPRDRQQIRDKGRENLGTGLTPLPPP